MSWNCLEPSIARSTQQRAYTKKQEIHIKKGYVQYHCQYNTALAIKKSIISDVCRWNHLEQNGTGNGLTQINTLINTLCVYNIVSAQNITLKTPIVKKSSILDVKNLSQIWLFFLYALNKKAKQLSMKIKFVPNY